jgi:hypothetical protein
MAEVFKADNAAIRSLLQSDEMLQLTISHAQSYGGELTPFVGFDRAKTIVKGEKDDRNNN